MGDNQIKFDKNLSPKLNLCYNTSLSQAAKNDEKNPIINLLSNFDEIKSILYLNDLNYINFLYLNSFKINKILYDSDEIIKITIKNDVNISFFVILSLLIEENSTVVNYTYSSKLIDILNKEQIKLKNEKIQKIIIAKIILELITNYEENDNNEEKSDEKDLSKIKFYNNKFIQDNINELKNFEITINDILTKKIDEIYVKIITYFFINQKLDDSDDYAEKIFKEIEIKSLNLTNLMFDNISNLLDKNKNYLKEFIIKEYDDLFNSRIINFYYTLLRYIIKNNYYIYTIPFLLETRNKIKKIIKSNLYKFYNTIKSKKDERLKIEFYLGAFIEYKYYLNKSLKIIKENEINSSMANSSFLRSLNMDRNNNNNYGMNNNISIGSSQSSGLFNSPSYLKEKEENSGRSWGQFDIEERPTEYKQVQENCKNEIAFQILSDSSFKFKFYKNDKTIKYECTEIKIYGEKQQNNNLEYYKNLPVQNDIVKVNYTKFMDILYKILERIKVEFSGIFDFAITLIFIANRQIVDSIFQIECTYKLEINNENIPEFKDNNILNKELVQGLNFIINEIEEHQK